MEARCTMRCEPPHEALLQLVTFDVLKLNKEQVSGLICLLASLFIKLSYLCAVSAALDQEVQG